jgi:cell division inhibitor SulA
MSNAASLHHLNAWDCSRRAGRSLCVPSGIPGLDELLPASGWPKGDVVEIIVPDMFAEATGLLLPALRRLSCQGRTIALVTPPFAARACLFTDPEINASHLLQVNPHPGRSALWTVESLLETGACSAVLAWPGCETELMDLRLQRAAGQGRSLCVLFRYAGLARRRSGVATRLQLEVSEAGTELYRVDGAGRAVAGITL